MDGLKHLPHHEMMMMMICLLPLVFALPFKQISPNKKHTLLHLFVEEHKDIYTGHLYDTDDHVDDDEVSWDGGVDRLREE